MVQSTPMKPSPSRQSALPPKDTMKMSRQMAHDQTNVTQQQWGDQMMSKDFGQSAPVGSSMGQESQNQMAHMSQMLYQMMLMQQQQLMRTNVTGSGPILLPTPSQTLDAASILILSI